MAGWHHQCHGHELRQTSGDGEGHPLGSGPGVPTSDSILDHHWGHSAPHSVAAKDQPLAAEERAQGLGMAGGLPFPSPRDVHEGLSCPLDGMKVQSAFSRGLLRNPEMPKRQDLTALFTLRR